jgi:flagellar capping protein FliD
MTGRRAGICAGVVAPGAMNALGMFSGLGCRRGGAGMMRGAGFQARNQFAAQQGVQANAMVGNEKDSLTRQVDLLEKQLQQVKQRLESVSDRVE